MATPKSKAKRNIGDEIIEGMGDFAAFLVGERTDLVVHRVPVPAPVASVIETLKKRRVKSKLTLAGLGEKSGITRETLTRLESGAIANPTYSTLAAYANAVGCRLSIKVVGKKEIKGTATDGPRRAKVVAGSR